ncbi:MAG: SufS family cysteine desulfurase [Gammaproteobacteria bacterium]|nr:SufS family cysteine desulfurase [Gammaproteobacteria bacterium]
MSEFPIAQLRREFKQLSTRVAGSPVIYLDNAATTQKPRCVIDALSRCYQQSYANVHRSSHALSRAATSSFEQARTIVAEAINAKPNEVIWTKGTTESINLVARTFGDAILGAGDEIVISQIEHHANIVPWQQLAQRKGLKVRFARCQSNGELDIAHFESLINKHTKLVALHHVSNVTGQILPVDRIIESAKSVGAKVLLDGAQAIAHLEIDVERLGCDFYVFSGHKAYGPTGIGVLWARYELLEQMPPFLGGGEMISVVDEKGFEVQPPPLKFEPGTPPWPEAVALGAAFEWLEKQRAKGAMAYEHGLFEYARNKLATLPQLRLFGCDHDNVGVISMSADASAADIAAYLDTQGIALRSGAHCAQPLMAALGVEGLVRVSLAVYNTTEEIDALVEALQRFFELSVESKPLEEVDLSFSGSTTERFAKLMSLGQQLNPSSPELRSSDNLVRGCETNVWLSVDGRSKTLSFEGDADSTVMRGLIWVMQHWLSGKTANELAKVDIDDFLSDLGVGQFITPTRRRGASAMIAHLQAGMRAGR